MRTKWDIPVAIFCVSVIIAMLIYGVFIEPQVRVLARHEREIAGVMIHVVCLGIPLINGRNGYRFVTEFCLAVGAIMIPAYWAQVLL